MTLWTRLATLGSTSWFSSLRLSGSPSTWLCTHCWIPQSPLSAQAQSESLDSYILGKVLLTLTKLFHLLHRFIACPSSSALQSSIQNSLSILAGSLHNIPHFLKCRKFAPRHCRHISCQSKFWLTSVSNSPLIGHSQIDCGCESKVGGMSEL